jgi:hypothetical protein
MSTPDLDPERFHRRAQGAAGRAWAATHPEEVPEDEPKPSWEETPAVPVVAHIAPAKPKPSPRSRRPGRTRNISPEARVRMAEGGRKAAEAREAKREKPRDPSVEGVRPEGGGLDGPEMLEIRDPGCHNCIHAAVCALRPLIPHEIGVPKLDQAFHLRAVIVLECRHFLAKG